MLRKLTGTLLIASSICFLLSCTPSISAKEFSNFVNDSSNGYTKTATSGSNAQWTVTLAPAELMAVNALKKNKPTAEEFNTTKEQYSDLTYFILKVKNEPALNQVNFCDGYFHAGCAKAEYASFLCQEIINPASQNKEFLIAFPKELAECGTEISLFFDNQTGRDMEKIVGFNKSELNTLPTIKLY